LTHRILFWVDVAYDVLIMKYILLEDWFKPMNKSTCKAKAPGV